jgi:uncharacterized membrane protein
MATVEKSIEVNVPVRRAYDQWTQFESFPQFMEGVKEVRQLDDTHLHWRAEIGGKEVEWDAEITEQEPDKVIAWRSTSGRQNDGMVHFEAMGPTQTRIDVGVDYDPEGLVETIGDKLGFTAHRLEGDLERFKHFIEQQPAPTGAYRGEVHGGQETNQTDTRSREMGDTTMADDLNRGGNQPPPTPA